MKMKFSKFILIPMLIAALAAVLSLFTTVLANTGWFVSTVGFTWISFQSWAVYFFAGCTPKGGARALIGYAMGIIASIIIMVLGGWLTANGISGMYATALAIFIIVIPVMCLERVPWFDLIPALFIGSGAFFALMTYEGEAGFCKVACTELVFCLIGLIFGWITIILRSRYEACVAKKAAK